MRVLAPQATTLLGITVGADDLTTVAGEGSYGPYLVDGLAAIGQTGELNFPTGLAVDAAGNLLVADGDIARDPRGGQYVGRASRGNVRGPRRPRHRGRAMSTGR